MWIFLLVSAFQVVNCYEFFSSSFSVTDQCINVCKDAKLPILEPDKYENVFCQRGCRFFNIINFENEMNVNVTKKECHISCHESYILAKETEICKKGCDLMSEKRQKELSTFLVFTQVEESNNIVLAEPDIEILENDLLSDPSMKSQLEVGFNIDYKIPETHIRTMPIEVPETNEQIKTNDSGDWLDCASRNSGIPRWILLSTMLGAILVAVWLTLSMDSRRGHEECILDDDLLDDIPDDKNLIENYIIEKDPSILEKYPTEYMSNNAVSFVAPPKYSEITEIGNSGPPRYSDVDEKPEA